MRRLTIEGYEVERHFYRPPVHTNGPANNCVTATLKDGSASTRASDKRLWVALDEALCELIDHGWDGEPESVQIRVVTVG